MDFVFLPSNEISKYRCLQDVCQRYQICLDHHQKEPFLEEE